MSDQSLKIIEQKEVSFYEDNITAVRVEDGTVYVPIRPICELLGISWSSQQNRIQRDNVLSEVAVPISVFVTNTQGQGQSRKMVCLPLEFVSGFLFGVNASRVKTEVKERLIRYQKECYQVLSEAFFEGRLTNPGQLEKLLEADSPAVQAYKTFQALTKMARQQVLLENRVNTHEERIEKLESVFGDPKHTITPYQASQISQAVKLIARVMGNEAKHYQGVYGEFYRYFGVTSYKQLPQSQFKEAMKFLNDWYLGYTGEELKI